MPESLGVAFLFVLWLLRNLFNDLPCVDPIGGPVALDQKQEPLIGSSLGSGIARRVQQRLWV